MTSELPAMLADRGSCTDCGATMLACLKTPGATCCGTCIHRATSTTGLLPQTHPAMALARNIGNQILDEAGTDVATRQRINDDCDQFVAKLIIRAERHARESVGDAIDFEIVSMSRSILPAFGAGLTRAAEIARETP